MALDHMTRALEAAKQARDRGVNVSWARTALKEARSAFEAGKYALAMQRADEILGRFGFSFDSAPSFPVPNPGASTTATAPGPADLGAAAGRLAVASETVRLAKAHGFNIQVAKATLKEARRAFKAKDYARTVQLADQAIQLSGSTGRVQM